MADWRMSPGAGFGFSLKGMPAERFHVLRFSGTEEVSQLYRYQLEVVDSDEAPLLADLLDGTATLTITPRKDVVEGSLPTRQVGGLISEARLTGRSDHGFI